METSRRSKRRNRHQTTAQLLDAAVACITEEGPTALTITAIAQRAGYDKVLIYRYFKSLDGVAAAIADSYVLYPTAAETFAIARRSGNPIQSIASALCDLIAGTPLAKALIGSRWHIGGDPLAAGLVGCRRKWLEDSMLRVSDTWADASILAIIQSLAEESASVGDDLAWHHREAFSFADDWQWPEDVAKVAEATTAPDTLPDNLL